MPTTIPPAAILRPDDKGKPWWRSVTLLTLGVSALARLAAAFGIAEITAEDEVALVALLGAAIGVALDGLAAWGRIRARTRIRA